MDSTLELATSATIAPAMPTSSLVTTISSVITWESRIPWIYASFFVCFLTHHVLSPVISSLIWHQYCGLHWRVRMEWNSRIVSSLHAFIVSILSTYSLISELDIWSTPFEHCGPVATIALSITTGYCICDIISMPIYWGGAGLYTHIFHHFMVMGSFFYSLRYGVCICFAVFRLASEYSTPFANQRWFYRTLGHPKSSPKIWLSTLFFCLLFFLFRCFWIPPYWFLSYRVYGTPEHLKRAADVSLMTAVWIYSCIGLDVLNIYWSKQVVKMFFRLFKNKNH